MRRLYLRIYLAVLASIALSILLAGTAWRFLGDPQSFAPRQQFLVAAATAMLPPASAPAVEQQKALERWRDLSGFEIAMFDSRGKLLGAAGGDIVDPGTGDLRRFRGFARRSVTLEDGRTIFAQPPAASRGLLHGLGWLLSLALIGFAVAVSAWPVVRRLTRNLERLESGVAAFGKGDLSARAHVRGRDEVARLADTFNRTAERIQTLVQSKRTLLANASHELRSPLARLRMSAENLPADTPEAVKQEIARNVRELDSLVAEILLSSRLEATGDDGLQREDVDLRVLAAEECARVPSTPGADFHAGAGSDRMVRGDAKLLQRLIRNLVENAVRYGAGSRVEVALYGRDAALVLDVCDRGPGVAQGERERIFEPFYRPQGASERAGGVGLGLSLVQQIAQAHGGTVECLPREGGGACFRTTIRI